MKCRPKVWFLIPIKKKSLRTLGWDQDELTWFNSERNQVVKTKKQGDY
jgi:hypothetical protein